MLAMHPFRRDRAESTADRRKWQRASATWDEEKRIAFAAKKKARYAANKARRASAGETSATAEATDASGGLNQWPEEGGAASSTGAASSSGAASSTGAASASTVPKAMLVPSPSMLATWPKAIAVAKAKWMPHSLPAPVSEEERASAKEEAVDSGKASEEECGEAWAVTEDGYE